MQQSFFVINFQKNIELRKEIFLVVSSITITLIICQNNSLKLQFLLTSWNNSFKLRFIRVYRNKSLKLE